MATSGTIKTNSYEGRYYQLAWKATQSTKDNQSTISWTLSAVGGDSSWFAERTVKVTLGGTTRYSKTARVERYAGKVAAGSFVVKHSSSGAGSFAYDLQIAVYADAINLKTSGTVTLDSIPRKSSLSVSNGTLGTAQTLTVTRQNSAFTHTIVAQCGTASATICTKSTDTSLTFTPPLSWSAQNKTGTAVSVKYTITTYNGTTSLGSTSYTRSCAIPASVKPSCTIAVSESTSYGHTYGAPLQRLSKLAITVKPTTAQGAEISAYSTVVDGITYSGASVITDELTSSGTLTIKTTVRDTRGRTGTAQTTINVLSYNPPKITRLSVYRALEDGTENAVGEFCRVEFDASVYALDSTNTATYTLKYKRTADTSYTSVSLSKYANVYTVDNGVYVFPAESASAYDVVLEAADAFGTSTAASRKTSVSTGSTPMHWLPGGLGMAIGKIAEIKGVFDVALKTLFRNHAVFENDREIRGMHSDGNEYTAFHPVTKAGNTSIGYGLYTARKGATNLYGNEVNICVGNLGSKDIFRPYLRRGDSFTVSINTAGYITNGAKTLNFIIPVAQPIIGNPNVSVASVVGFTLRQNGQYTHGSSGSASVKPSKITATLNRHYLRVAADFSAVTNAQNNGAIGVYFNGTITFS